MRFQSWFAKVRVASSFGVESAVVGSRAGNRHVGYNDELPVPGVVIKQDDVFVEGIARDRKKFCVCLRVAKAGHVSMLFFLEKRSIEADSMAGMIGGFILKHDEDGTASGTCALAKNPRGNFGYCLRCDFLSMLASCFRSLHLCVTHRSCSDDPQTSTQDWELKTNRKIVLCFDQPEPRAHWLDVHFPPTIKFPIRTNSSNVLYRLSYTHSRFQASLSRMFRSEWLRAKK